jgi:uncharacterized membrane protein
MYAIRNLILSLCFCVVALIPIRSLPGDPTTNSPDVRAVLFYDPDTSQSKELFTFYLPALFERYGTRLEVSVIDLSRPAGRNAYAAVAERLGFAPEPGVAPMVVAGDRALVGLFDIATELGDNFDELAKDPGAKLWPPDAALEELLPGGVEEAKARVASEGVLQVERDAPEAPDALPLPDRIANAMAFVVLLGMVATLVRVVLRLRRPYQMSGAGAAGVLLFTLFVGLGISGYTAYTAIADVDPMCGPVGGCSAVQGSEYSKLFGVPMGVLGLVGYGLILVTWLMARHISPRGGGWYWLPWAVALFGVLFSLRLTALEPFVIRETCLWCLGSAISITVALWLLSGFTRKGARVNPNNRS